MNISNTINTTLHPVYIFSIYFKDLLRIKLLCKFITYNKNRFPVTKFTNTSMYKYALAYRLCLWPKCILCANLYVNISKGQCPYSHVDKHRTFIYIFYNFIISIPCYYICHLMASKFILSINLL